MRQGRGSLIGGRGGRGKAHRNGRHGLNGHAQRGGGAGGRGERGGDGGLDGCRSCRVGGDDDEVEDDRAGGDGDGDSIGIDPSDLGHGGLDGSLLGGVVVRDITGSLNLDAHLVLRVAGDLSRGGGGRNGGGVEYGGGGALHRCTQRLGGGERDSLPRAAWRARGHDGDRGGVGGPCRVNADAASCGRACLERGLQCTAIVEEGRHLGDTGALRQHTPRPIRAGACSGGHVGGLAPCTGGLGTCGLDRQRDATHAAGVPTEGTADVTQAHREELDIAEIVPAASVGAVPVGRNLDRAGHHTIGLAAGVGVDEAVATEAHTTSNFDVYRGREGASHREALSGALAQTVSAAGHVVDRGRRVGAWDVNV
eukprot:scaffold26650_cov63-Phaeocystis_antarctica.AAC.11